MAKQQTKARPVREVRLGRIRAAIWENETQNGTRHNVTLSRLYKDGDDWKDSTSFGRDDLPLVAKVADLAHSWIFTQASAAAHGNGSAEPTTSRASTRTVRRLPTLHWLRDESTFRQIRCGDPLSEGGFGNGSAPPKPLSRSPHVGHWQRRRALRASKLAVQVIVAPVHVTAVSSCSLSSFRSRESQDELSTGSQRLSRFCPPAAESRWCNERSHFFGSFPTANE